jgi:hypothetical protein
MRIRITVKYPAEMMIVEGDDLDVFAEESFFRVIQRDDEGNPIETTIIPYRYVLWAKTKFLYDKPE